MKYLIDSGIIYDILKERSVCRPLVEQLLMEGHLITLLCLIRYEVLRGYYKSIFSKQQNEIQKERERQRIREFESRASLFHGISVFPPECIDRAAAIYGETQAAGVQGISDVDILLFTVAQLDGYTVVSRDGHLKTLSSMYGVPFEDWTQPPSD